MIYRPGSTHDIVDDKLLYIVINLPQPSLNFSWRYFPNRLELPFMTVAALPNASNSGFTFSQLNEHDNVQTMHGSLYKHKLINVTYIAS